MRFEDIALDELELAEKVYDFVGLEMHPKVKHMILMNRKKREIEIERKRKRRAVRARVEDLNIFGKFGLYRGPKLVYEQQYAKPKIPSLVLILEMSKIDETFF